VLVIEEFEIGLGYLKDLAPEPTDDAPGRQQVVALHAVLVS
jgi:hypothetical protein